MERSVTQKQDVKPQASPFSTRIGPAPMEIAEEMEGNLVTMVATDANENGYIAEFNGTPRKPQHTPQQVLVKLIEDNSLSLDMVRIIAQNEIEQTSGSYSILSRDGPVAVHKLSGSTVSGDTMSFQYSNPGIAEVKRHNIDSNSSSNTVWSCAYCHLVFTTTSAIARHQERSCSKKPSQHTNKSIEKNIQIRPTQVSSSSLRNPNENSNVIQKSNNEYETKTSDVSGNRNLNLESVEISNSDNISNGLENEEDFDMIWTCDICNEEFNTDKDLGEHLLSHSIQELSMALIKVSSPSKRKKVIDKEAKDDRSGIKDELLNKSSEIDSPLDHENGDSSIEENVDDPDPITQQNKTPTKIKPGPKPQPKEKREKRKYVRKKSIQTRQDKKTSPGQGSRDPHKCYVCLKVLSSRGNLAKHLVQHKENKPWICEVCGQGFNAKRDQQHHYLYKHTNQRPHICELCGKSYGDARVLEEHKQFHKDVREFSCELCGKMFRTAKCVARHKKRHERDKNFICGQCFKPFAVKADLKSHIHKVHKNQGKKAAVLNQQLQGQPTSVQVLTVHQSHLQQNKSKEVSGLLLTVGGTSSSELLHDQILTAELDTTTLHHAHSQTKDTIFISDQMSLGGGYEDPLATTDGVGAAETVAASEHYIMNNHGDEQSQVDPGSHPGLSIMYTTQHHQVRC
ncbi:unnamed protein product, partial [Meganyctiphanes norvegica]